MLTLFEIQLHIFLRLKSIKSTWKYLAEDFRPSSDVKFWEPAIWLWSAPILKSKQIFSYDALANAVKETKQKLKHGILFSFGH